MKKIFDFIFETVEDEKDEEQVIVEAPVVKQRFEAEKKEPAPVVTPTVAPTPKENLQKVEVVARKEEVRKNDVLNRPKAKSGYNIEVTEKRRTYIPKEEYQQPIKYEYQPPLSPIFGILEEKDDTKQKGAFSIVGVTKSNSKIGTVLSPIYGTVEIEKDFINENLEKKPSIIEENIQKVEVEVPFKEEKEELTYKDIRMTQMSPINITVTEDTPKEEKVETLTPEVETVVQEVEVKTDDDYFKEYFNRISKEEESTFANRSLEEILDQPDDETHIVDQEISLFDDNQE